MNQPEDLAQKVEQVMNGIREYDRQTRHKSHIDTDFPAYRELVALGKDALPYLQDKMNGVNEPRWHVLVAVEEILKNSGVNLEFPEQIQGGLGNMEKYAERIITELRFPRHGGVTPEFLSNQPIPLEAYQCPKCNATLAMSYENALKHVNVPVGIELPEGLALFKPISADIQIILPKPSIENGRREHELLYNLAQYCPVGNCVANVLLPQYSQDFYPELKQGRIRPLSDSEFNNLERESSNIKVQITKMLGEGYAPLKLLRTTPELEEILRGKK